MSDPAYNVLFLCTAPEKCTRSHSRRSAASELMLWLPLEKLDRLALQERLSGIGKS